MNSTNTIITLGTTTYRINNNGTIIMDKVYANAVTTAATDAVPGVWVSNFNSGTLSLKADTANVFNSDIINGTTGDYKGLVLAGNKSSGNGRRNIMMYDDVSLYTPNAKFCIGSTCINEADLKTIKLSCSFTTGVIGVGSQTIPLTSFSPQPLPLINNKEYTLSVKRGDNNSAWRYYGILWYYKGIFSNLISIDKNLIDVVISSAGSALTLNVISNGYPDTWTLTLS